MSTLHLEWNPVGQQVEVAKAEIRQLKPERFGKKTAHSNGLNRH